MNDNVPPRLYKYTDLGGAQLILEHMSFRWRSVLEFNDPFECSLEVQSLEAGLDKAVRKKCMELLSHPKKPVIQDSSAILANTIAELYERHKSGELALPEAQNELSQHLVPAFLALPAVNEGITQVRKEWGRTIRVLCLSEACDDLLMWAHYAKYHEGVVFQIEPELDYCLSDPVRMRYSNQLTPLTAPSEMADVLLGLESEQKRQVRTDEASQDLMFTKSTHWEYEREWRCAFLLEDEPDADSTEMVTDINFNPKAITRIILGCRMSEENQEIITKLAREKLSNIPIVQAKLNPSLFKLDIPDE